MFENMTTSTTQSILLNLTTYSAGEIDNSFPSFVSNVAISGCIGVLLLLGFLGSFSTMTVILVNKSLHTKANFFILSLCVSDLISALVCSPLWLYRRTWGFHTWEWGQFLCKFYWTADYATNYTTSLHIVAFAMLRFVAIKWPFLPMKMSKKATLIFICALWIIATIAALPLYFLMGVDLMRASRDMGSMWPSCSIDNRGECCTSQYKLYIDVCYSVLFFVPDILLVVLSIWITRSLVARKRFLQRYASSVRSNKGTLKEQLSKNSDISSTIDMPDLIVNHAVVDAADAGLPPSDVEKPENLPNPHPVADKTSSVPQSENETNIGREVGTFVQLSSIVVCFMVGYLPQTVYMMHSTNTSDKEKSVYSDYWFGVASYLCIRLSECMNPIMYNMGSSNIRSKTMKLWRKILRCK